MRSVIDFLNARFRFHSHGTSLRTEVTAGVATFMTMAYIIFVNPLILSSAGMPIDGVVAATCLGAAVPTFLMGWWANYPFALASGMGLNASLALQATQPGMNWQTMMGIIVVEGVLVTVFVLTNIRQKVMDAIPMNLKRAISAGIGLFIAFLGLQQMGWVAKGPVEEVYLTHGNLIAPKALIATAGFIIISVLLARNIRGAIVLGILCTTALALIADQFLQPGQRLVHLPAKIASIPNFNTFAHADIVGALKPALLGTIFAFMITDFFDTMGTVVGVGSQGGFLDRHGGLPRLKRILLVDSLAAVWGGLCGASSVTTYIESAAGVSQGGRTGMVSLVVAVLFLCSLFMSPIVGAIPAVATAPALLVVGFLMMIVVREMDFQNTEEGIAGFIILLMIPFSQSISTGIGMGFVAFVLIKLLRQRTSEVSPWMYGVAAVFAISFALGNK